MGTPHFAAEALRAIDGAPGCEIALVVTTPDKPVGRGYKMKPSAVKEYALERGFRVFLPATLKDGDVVREIADAGADVIIVAAYGKLLPPEVLSLPRLGCINIHASLLPRLRGAAPINRAVMNGDTVGGVTIMYMAQGLDTGDIILQKRTDIPPLMTAGEYHDVLASLGGEAITEYLSLAASGSVPRTPQDDSLATYAAKITDDDRKALFSLCAHDLCNRIRGLSPVPGAYCFYGSKRIKLLSARVSDMSGQPGEVVSTDGGVITVACGSGSIDILTLQAEGKPVTDAASYLRGHKVEKGSFFECL